MRFKKVEALSTIHYTQYYTLKIVLFFLHYDNNNNNNNNERLNVTVCKGSII